MLKNFKSSKYWLLLPERSSVSDLLWQSTSAGTILSMTFRFELLGIRTDASPGSLLGLPFTLLSTVVCSEQSLLPDDRS